MLEMIVVFFAIFCLGYDLRSILTAKKWIAPAFLLATAAMGETVVFPHNGAIYASMIDENSSGLFVYEEPKHHGEDAFLTARRIGDTAKNLTPSFPEGKLRLLSPGWEHEFDPQKGLTGKKALPIPDIMTKPVLCLQVDYNGDGRSDVIVFSSDKYDAKARIYYGRADGSYAEPFVFQIDGKDFDATGIRSPHFVNLDDDDDFDFIHLNAEGRLIYYENRNTNSEPLYSTGMKLETKILLAATPCDWDRDQLEDLIVMTKEGKIGWMKQTEKTGHAPNYSDVIFFKSNGINPMFPSK